jgi:clathrin heavy chain
VLTSSYKLPLVAFTIYKKFTLNQKAIEVLVKHMDLSEAVEFSDTCKEPAVWSVLATAQLAAQQTVEAISMWRRGDRRSDWIDVLSW